MKLYQAEFTAHHDYIPFFAESFDEEVSAGEIREDDPNWQIRILFQQKPSTIWLDHKIKSLFTAISLPAPEIKIIELEDKNWVEENHKVFPAITTDKFHIYSEFSAASGELIDIEINPGMAFGTGQHETTYLCLEAIGWLSDNHQQFKNILDLGCGSGILAIAAAKIWPRAQITASDNDPVAVNVTNENFDKNLKAQTQNLKAIVSEGFSSLRHPSEGWDPASQAPDSRLRGNDKIGYDLILANILMNPLLEMAEDMKKHSTGTIILSGFKSDQTEEILNKYTALGFHPARIFVKTHWVAAVFTD